VDFFQPGSARTEGFQQARTRDCIVHEDFQSSSCFFPCVSACGHCAQVGPSPSESFPVGVSACQLQMNTPTTDLYPSSDLEEFETDLANGGLSQICAAQHLGPQHREQKMCKSREPKPQLIRSHPMGAGAIREEILLSFLDPVFHFSTGAVKLLVERGGVKPALLLCLSNSSTRCSTKGA